MPGPSLPPANRNKNDEGGDKRKIFIGGLMTQGIDQYTIRDDFSRFGEIEDCFVPMDREVPGKVRGFAFVTYREPEGATDAVREMHGRNYHGREITVNVAKPRGPDPKKEGGFLHQGGQGTEYTGKYDAGGRLRPEFRGSDERAVRYDRDDGRNDGERERDYQRDAHSHGNSYDGTGRYGDRDWRPQQTRYD